MGVWIVMNIGRSRVFVIGAAALVGIALLSGAAASNVAGASTKSPVQETPWAEDRVIEQRPAPASKSDTPAPRSDKAGALVDTVIELAEQLVPAGAKLVDAQEYADLNAAMATYVLNNDAFSVSIQRPEVPASIDEMAAGGEVSSSELATGSTQVEIIGADYEQTVIVRKSGLTITISRTGLAPAKAEASPLAKSSVEGLSTRLAAVVDTDALEQRVP